MTLRILVVEDDTFVAEVAAAALEGLGYTARLAEDAPIALGILAADPRFDLVFSDIRMPGSMNGIQLAERLAVLYPKLPVLLATGYSAEALSPAAKRFPVLSKPYTVNQLKTRIAQMTGQLR